jgi:hypothetical protein
LKLLFSPFSSCSIEVILEIFRLRAFALQEYLAQVPTVDMQPLKEDSSLDWSKLICAVTVQYVYSLHIRIET